MMRTTLSFGVFKRICYGIIIIFAPFYSCTNNGPGHIEAAGDSASHSNVFADLLRDDWKAPDTSTLTDSEKDRQIKYGRELIVHTGNFFGPNGTINKNANGMNCQNCHLEAGTKLWANSFCAVFSNYPKVRARSGTLEHLERRINDCMERSMNGKAIDSLSKEMRAIVAYINWVGKDVPKDSVPEGTSVVDLKYLDRAADPEKGKIVYVSNCAKCHGLKGNGQLNPDRSVLYPPLWGDRSFNTAAGMYRLSRLAAFAKSNMPFQKCSHDKPILTDEEAWDIAAYINSQPRPNKTFKNDWPNIAKKPIDHPFGPYADGFSEQQHKYGPFTEIKEYYKKNKATAQK